MAVKEIEPVITTGKFFKLFFILILVGVGFVAAVFMRPAQPTVELGSVKLTPTVPPVANTDLVETAQKTGEGILTSVKTKSQDLKAQVLGAMTQAVSSTASKSADAVSNFLLDQTVPKIVKQIDKLPAAQRETIKKNILNTLKPE